LDYGEINPLGQKVIESIGKDSAQGLANPIAASVNLP
jgi:hypothetical protein